jgi:hypothetical protein
MADKLHMSPTLAGCTLLALGMARAAWDSPPR